MPLTNAGIEWIKAASKDMKRRESEYMKKQEDKKRMKIKYDILYMDNLFDAIEQGDLDTVNAIIAAGVDVNSTDDDGETPIHVATQIAALAPNRVAVRINHLDIINALLAAGADINLLNGNGETPLHVAVEHGNLDAVNLLIAKGADLNSRTREDPFDDTPLHFATMGFRRGLAGDRPPNNLNIVNALIAAGANVNAINDDGYTPLHNAANGDINIVNALISAEADLNIRNVWGSTPLHIAARRSRRRPWMALTSPASEAVVDLLLAGADYNIRNNNGFTPLEEAQRSNNHTIVDLIHNYKLIQAKQRLNVALGLSGSSTLDSLTGGLEAQNPWYWLLKDGIPKIPKEVLLRQGEEDFIQSFADEGIVFTPRSSPKFGGKKRVKKKNVKKKNVKKKNVKKKRTKRK
jgi:ankyrin repeat protein